MVSTADNLRRGITSSSILDVCVVCRRERETIDLLFIHCGVAYCISYHFTKQCGLCWLLASAISILAKPWA